MKDAQPNNPRQTARHNRIDGEGDRHRPHQTAPTAGHSDHHQGRMQCNTISISASAQHPEPEPVQVGSMGSTNTKTIMPTVPTSERQRQQEGHMIQQSMHTAARTLRPHARILCGECGAILGAVTANSGIVTRHRKREVSVEMGAGCKVRIVCESCQEVNQFSV